MLAGTPSLISFSFIYLSSSQVFFSASPENTVFVISVRSLIGDFKLGARRKPKFALRR